MPLPTTIADLSTVAASNYPSGSDSPSTLDDVQRAHASFIAQLRDAIAPGLIQDFGGTTAPTGYLLCDGAAVSRTTYAALFAAISTSWGVGNGTTTFNVPDLRGRATIGSGTGTSLTARTTGTQNIGEETHALTTAELASHNHTLTDPGHTHADSGHSHLTPSLASPGQGQWSTGASVVGTTGATYTTNTGMYSGPSNAVLDTRTTGITLASNGSGTAHNNMQPSAVVTKIIKT